MQSYVTLSVITLVMCAMFARNIEKRFPDGAYRWFVRSMASVMLWTGFALSENLVAAPGWKVLFASASYVGIVSMPVCWLFFTYEFTDHGVPFTRRQAGAFWVVPVVILVLIATNPLHHWYWKSIRVAAPVDGAVMLDYDRGFPFLIHSIYAYGLVLAGTARILAHLWRNRMVRRQLLILAGILTPMVSNFLYLVGAVPLDFSAPAFSITCLTFVWVIISSEMEDRAELTRKVAQAERLSGIGRLAAGVAHEINNPLGFTKSNLEMMDKYMLRLSGLVALQDRLLKDARILNDAAWAQRREEIVAYMRTQHIDHILTDFSSLSRETEEGITRIETIVHSLMGYADAEIRDLPVSYDLNTGLADALVLVEPKLTPGIHVLLETTPLPQLMVDPHDMGRILMNLLSNAIQAVADKGGGGTVTVRTELRGGEVFLEVQDDGVGIRPEHVGRVFDPFFTTRAIGSGSGLGLSVARGLIVHKYKGDITVESTPGKGSRFLVRIPIPEGNDGVRLKSGQNTEKNAPPPKR